MGGKKNNSEMMLIIISLVIIGIILFAYFGFVYAANYIYSLFGWNIVSEEEAREINLRNMLNADYEEKSAEEILTPPSQLLIQ